MKIELYRDQKYGKLRKHHQVCQAQLYHKTLYNYKKKIESLVFIQKQSYFNTCFLLVFGTLRLTSPVLIVFEILDIKSLVIIIIRFKKFLIILDYKPYENLQ